MLRKTKINIIGLSLLSNDIECSHFKGADLTVGLFWAFAVDRSPAGLAGN